MRITKAKNRKIGLIISYVSLGAQILISIFFTPFILNTIGDREYGLYSFALSITTWLSVFLIAISSGFSKYLSKEKQEFGIDGERMAAGLFFKIFAVISFLVLLSGFLIFTLFWTGAIPLEEYNSAERITICFIMLSSFLTISITTVLTCYKSYLFYKQSFIVIYLTNLLAIILQTLISYICLLLGCGVISIALAHYGCSIVASIIQSFIAIHYEKYSMKILAKSKEEKEFNSFLFKEILIFSSFIIINTIVDDLNKSMDKTILGFVNADSVAYYQISSNLASYMVNLTTAIGVIFNQKMTDIYFSKEGQEGANKLFIRVSKYQMIISFLIVGGFASCGFEFINGWIGKDRIQVFYISMILLILYTLISTNTLANTSRTLQNLHKKASFIYLGMALTNVITSITLCALLEKEQAIYACVIGTAISTIIGQGIIMSIYDAKVTKLSIGKFYLNYFIVLLSAALSSSVPLLLFKFVFNIDSLNVWARMVIKGFVFVTIYSSTILLIYHKLIFEAFKIKKRNKFIKESNLNI